MFNFMVVLEKPATNFVLGFKTEGAAKAALENIKNRCADESVSVKDDYGRILECEKSNIASVMIEDNLLKGDMHFDQQLDAARANQSFVDRRNEDMELMRLFPGNAMQNVAGRA